MDEEIYRNEFGKERQAYPPKITRVESVARRRYFRTTVRPNIIQGFLERGVNDVTINLTGSVETNEAGPSSDIDCVVSRKNIEKLLGIEDKRFQHTATLVKRQVNKGSQYRIDFLIFSLDQRFIKT